MEYNKERFKKVFFEYDGKYSYDYCLDIIKWNHMDAPALNIEQERIPGAHRDVFYSEGTYANKVIDIECFLDVRHDITRKDAYIRRVKHWLNNANYKYKKIQFSDDEGAYYEGVCISNMLFEEVVEGLYKTLITFSCNPFRMKYTTTHKFNYNNKIQIFENEGVAPSPLKIKISYPDEYLPSGFKIIIKQNGEVYSEFDCDKPDFLTDSVEIISEDYSIKITNTEGEIIDGLYICNSLVFPHIPPGISEVNFKSMAIDEASHPTIVMEYAELGI